MVIALDTTLTEELKFEGYARDIIRQIQDMRKEADYQVTDRISLHISGTKDDTTGMIHDTVMHILEGFASMIEVETLSTLRELLINPDLEKMISLEEVGTIRIQIER